MRIYVGPWLPGFLISELMKLVEKDFPVLVPNRWRDLQSVACALCPAYFLCCVL